MRRPCIGRIQRQVMRSFIAAAGRRVRFKDLLRRAYPSVAAPAAWQRWSVYRALAKYGEQSGRGWWLPNAELMARIKGDSVG
jgi:hypothetical protein